MANTKLLPAWLAPASQVGTVTKFERKADQDIKATMAVPVGSRDVPLEFTVPADQQEVTALATALEQLARVLLENRPVPRQPQLKGVT